MTAYLDIVRGTACIVSSGGDMVDFKLLAEFAVCGLIGFFIYGEVIYKCFN